jgi:hypothetical protein
MNILHRGHKIRHFYIYNKMNIIYLYYFFYYSKKSEKKLDLAD